MTDDAKNEDNTRTGLDVVETSLMSAVAELETIAPILLAETQTDETAEVVSGAAERALMELTKAQDALQALRRQMKL